ncbi:MAG: hypothetical protein AMJ81_02515 [Phycisphaerae bacterium SM23_33]|nr:MAG: hypothetical protein AMJ81_02515 [Phycisphaerae bacterium SM23_33]
MPQVFTADQIFQIALELEETGQIFYEALAIACQQQRVAALCRRLARDESNHYRTFDQMRRRLAGGPAAHPLEVQQQESVQALINERVIPSPQAARELAAKGGLAETLDLAVKLEKDTVRLYQEMAAAVDSEDARAVRQIIAEEQNHVQELTNARHNLH